MAAPCSPRLRERRLAEVRSQFAEEVVVRSGHQEVRSQPSGTGTGAVVDLLVGAVALGDGAVSVIGEPERVAVW